MDGVSGGAAGVGPVHGLSDGFVEVGDEPLELLNQVLLRREVAVAHHSAVDDAEENFDLVESRTVFGQIDESDAVAGV